MVKNKKSKGSSAERELIHLFWKTGWAAMRAAGSGSTTHPSPDILAGNNLRKIAIECKSTKSIRQYLTSKEINELKKFSTIFGAEPWIGVRFDKLNWYFLTLEDLEQTENNYSASLIIAKRKGLLFEELISP